MPVRVVVVRLPCGSLAIEMAKTNLPMSLA
jgi:hypothetical protein